MQIDFHHATTWVVARAAGFSVEEANIIAYASQYVDDATNYGNINFTNGAAYERVPSARGVLDYKDFDYLKKIKVWVPFHFLPANGGLPAGESPEGGFINKLVCNPGSYIAQDMVEECIKDKHRPYALHRLGITSHVFVNTWGHQGFSGVQHAMNQVNDLKGTYENPAEVLTAKVGEFFGDLLQEHAPSLGDSQAHSISNLPYEVWNYTNSLGETILRNNPDDFVNAADELCKVYQRYIAGDAWAEVQGLNEGLKYNILVCFKEFNQAKSEERHAQWLDAIAEDFFGVGAATLSYIAKGEHSWKHQALDTTRIDGDDEYIFSPDFITSNWKYFHDAVKKHRQAIIDDILPRYGICVA